MDQDQNVQNTPIPNQGATGSNWIVWVIGLVVIAALLVAAIFYYRNANKETTGTESTPAAQAVQTQSTDELSSLQVELEAIDVNSDAELNQLETQL